jgi:bacillithiol system protein YtxJ
MSNWPHITSLEDLEAVNKQSYNQTVLIFKHSTRCSISSAALGRMQRGWNHENAPIYYLDLIKHRDISNAIAQQFGIEHQSPQVLVIKDGICVQHESHFEIEPNAFNAAI